MLGGSHRTPNSIATPRERPCKQFRESIGAGQAPSLLQSTRKASKIAANDKGKNEQARLQCSTPDRSTAMRIWAVSDVHADYKENMEW